MRQTQTIPNDGLWYEVGRLGEHPTMVEAPTLPTIDLDFSFDGTPCVRNTGPEPVEVEYA